MAGAATTRVPPSRVLLVASFGAFLAFLDATIVNVAFPSIRESFAGTTISELSWVLNAYNIVFAASLILCGRLTDLVGRRRSFVARVAVFTVASGLCGIAPSVEMLVLARIVQAFGAAMLVPAALVIAAFPAERRAHAIGVWGATAAVRTMMIGSGGAVAAATSRGAWVVSPSSMGVGLLEFHQMDRMVESGRAASGPCSSGPAETSGRPRRRTGRRAAFSPRRSRPGPRRRPTGRDVRSRTASPRPCRGCGPARCSARDRRTPRRPRVASRASSRRRWSGSRAPRGKPGAGRARG